MNLAQDYFTYVAEMEYNGFYCDLSRLKESSAVWTSELQVVTSRLEDLTGEMNHSSSQQLLAFFEKEGLSLKNTSADTLQAHSTQHLAIPQILEYRRLQKLIGTNCEGCTRALDPDGLLHSSYGVESTDTGRLSSSSPNCQNVPPACRHWFKSRHPSGKILSTDLSSLEYRLLAHMSRSPKLLRLFNAGEDLHDDTARAIYSIEGDVSKELRKKAKTINYSSCYGVGKKRFYATIGKEDPALYKRTKELFPRVNDWKDNLRKELHRTKTISTPSGRVRVFDEKVSASVEREAFNWRLQSFGHDILMIYLMESYDRLVAAKVDFLLVEENHDSFLLDLPAHSVSMAEEIISDLARDLVPLILSCFGERITVPVYADVEVLECWS